ncbi:SRPBCC domain-containing protein [Kitasatospora sp. NPDC006697]|uniref:SRPBCC domain-containing protein n=1 Tax=Kitasatospora sp. NPDC006697 TaxID=3364020 RepID=UPI00369FC44C
MLAQVVLPGCDRRRALAAFTEAAVVRQWWGGGELSAELTPGGAYRVRFEAVGHTLVGTVVDYRPDDAALVFGWAWEHQPVQAGGYAYEVAVRVREAGDGSRCWS